MDDKIRNPAAGRDETPHDAGDDTAASRDRASAGPGPATDQVIGEGRAQGRIETAPATRLPDPGPDAEPVTVCAWCPSLHILKMARREQDIVVIYWQGKELRILRNGVSLKISHAICQPCRERLHSRTAAQDTRP